MKRYALVWGLSITREKVDRYLPSNYRTIWSGEWPTYENGPEERVVVIEGTDNHGWTLDDYVIPRLGSGLMAAKEIDLSHPIMKIIPEERVEDIVNNAPGWWLKYPGNPKIHIVRLTRAQFFQLYPPAGRTVRLHDMSTGETLEEIPMNETIACDVCNEDPGDTIYLQGGTRARCQSCFDSIKRYCTPVVRA